MFNMIGLRILLIIFMSLALLVNSKQEKVILNLMYIVCIAINAFLLADLIL